MFEGIKRVISARIQPRSYNKGNTYYHFVYQLQEAYNQKIDNILHGAES